MKSLGELLPGSLVATLSKVGDKRRVQPEILDSLPANAPGALASRRDLHLINKAIGSNDWFRCRLRERRRAKERVLELGAGDGELGSKLNLDASDLAGIDFAPRPVGWPLGADWFENDVRVFSKWADYPVVIGNLFFHHFNTADLAELGARIDKQARMVIACEPRRHERSIRLFRWFCVLIRAHPITRHDGAVSIVGGFVRDELPRLLGLDAKRWRWRVQETWLGAYRLVAERRA